MENLNEIQIKVSGDCGLLNELFHNGKRYSSWSYSMYKLTKSEIYCYTVFRRYFYKFSTNIFKDTFYVSDKVLNRLVQLLNGVDKGHWQKFLNNN